MQLTDKVMFAAVLIVGTQATRLLPLVFENRMGGFIKDESVRSLINDVLFFLLIAYCFRDVAWTLEYALRVSTAVYVFVVQYKFGNTLFSIFSGTLLYMLGRYAL